MKHLLRTLKVAKQTLQLGEVHAKTTPSNFRPIQGQGKWS
jgi:hypothetical protein